MEMKIIDEQLVDKQQTVTYKYLVEKLSIHPNKAKNLLKEYVAQITDKKYSITIVIGGTLQENDEFCIVLAHDDHIETVRRRFKHISFEHIFSIQPIGRFDDINNALYLVDSSLNINVNLPSSIKKKENVAISKQIKQTAMEINVHPTEETNSTSCEVSNHSKHETKLDKAEKKKTDLNVSLKSNEKKTLKLEVTEIKVSLKKKTDLNVSLKSNQKKTIKPEATEIKVSPKKNNSDFFSKFKMSNNSSKNSDTIKNDSINNCSTDKSTTKEDSKIMEVKLPKNETQENSPDKTQENSPNKTQTKNQKKSTKKKENKIKKKSNQKVKRKRIQTFNSSDEEIDSEEEDKKRSEPIMDVDDEIDLVQPTPPRPTQREYRKMEKKTTTSTFIDADGFVCTAKEVQIVEMESEPSESVGNVENSVPKELNIEPVAKRVKPNESVPEKKKSKNKQSKNSTSQGMKQSSLTSFFKTK